MTLQLCHHSRQVAQYAACLLEEADAEDFDSHLEQCSECRQTLASVVEGGVGPEWLSWCREPLPITPTTDELTSDAPATGEKLAGREGELDRSVSTSAALIEGPVVEHRYRRVRRVGEGGMGVVWEGWDSVMRRRVALKELRSRKDHAPQTRRLLHEASSLARLSHPNIVSVYEMFMTNEQPTMVMEYVDGPTLSQWCGDRVISECQAAALMETLAKATQHAHDNGVIHRDLKPSNVLLSFPRDQNEVHLDLGLATPKLSDFGLARIADDPSMTLAGDLIGTPAFMAPEQARGDASQIGPATDVYGLGATLYDLLTGTAPHVAEDPVATLERVRDHEPISPRLLRPELSKDIETICMKCLRKAPSERYSSAMSLAEDLRAYLEGRPIAARPQSRYAILARWCRRHKLLAAASLTTAGLLVTLVVGAIVFAKREQTLRKEADAAAMAANKAETLAREEAKRAEAATQRVQDHFRMTMGAVDNIAHLLNATATDQHGFQRASAERLRLDAIAIYGEYLKSLPEQHQWIPRDIHVALRHAEISAEISPKHLEESRRRLEALVPILERLEREHPNDSETNSLLHWHSRAMGNCASRAGDTLAAAPWYAKQAQCIERNTIRSPEDLGQFREHSEVLFTTSLCYVQGGNRQEGLRYAKLSVEAARRVLKKSADAEQDRFTLVHRLGWVATCLHGLGDRNQLKVVDAELKELFETFAESSPRHNEIQSLKAYVLELCENKEES